MVSLKEAKKTTVLKRCNHNTKSESLNYGEHQINVALSNRLCIHRYVYTQLTSDSVNQQIEQIALSSLLLLLLLLPPVVV
jgi:adenylate kinase